MDVKLLAVLVAGIGVLASPGQSDIPGRVEAGFHVGAAASANDHNEWGARGTGYTYYGEVGYEIFSWLVAPTFAFGYSYANGEPSPGEEQGHRQPPTGVRAESNDYYLGLRTRLAFGKMRFRPYAGAGFYWTEYHRELKAQDYVLEDHAAGGRGYGFDAGLEYFPDPSAGFAFRLGYRFAAAAATWRQPPPKTPGFDAAFTLTQNLVTLGVTIYAL